MCLIDNIVSRIKDIQGKITPDFQIFTVDIINCDMILYELKSSCVQMTHSVSHLILLLSNVTVLLKVGTYLILRASLPLQV